MFKFAFHEKTAKHTCEAKCSRARLLGVLNKERYAKFENGYQYIDFWVIDICYILDVYGIICKCKMCVKFLMLTQYRL